MPSRFRRAWWTHGLAALAVAVAVAVATASAFAHQQPSVLPTVASVAGTCHPGQDPLELLATLSDTAPAVPCDRPHQTETVFQMPITGPLGAQASRPNPELLESTYAKACVSYSRIRKFLGARAPDVYWGVDAVARFPTSAEWSRGVRTLDCDLYEGTNTATGPLLYQDLAGVLRRRDSASFRLCRLGSTLLTCDRPHDAEATSPNAVLPAGPWPGAAREEAEAVRVCTPIASAYLAAPLASRRALSMEPTPITAPRWKRGARSVDCWISTSGAPTTGTVRGGLR